MADPLGNKSYELSLKVIKLSKLLVDEKKEFVLGRQLLKSGTSIGAQIREAKYAESPADFRSKLSIAMKEANETLYWLLLLRDSLIVSQDQFEDLYPLCDELVAMLVTSVKTSKRNQGNNQ